MKAFGERIADALVEDGVLQAAQLQEVMAQQKSQGGRLLKILLDKGYVTEVDMMVSMGRALGTPPVNLGRMKVPKDVGDLIPRDIAKNHHLLPIAKLENKLFVAMADPLNVVALDDVRNITKLDIIPMITTERMVTDAIANLDAQASQGMEEIVKDEAADIEISESTEDEQADVTASDADAAPVVKIANLMLATVVKDKASDVHLECYEKTMKLRYRIDGALYDYPPPPKSMQNALISRLKIMAHLDISERRLPQDGRIRIKMAGRDIDFRMSFLPCKYGEKVVGRILDKSAIAGSIKEIGMDEDTYKKFSKALDEPQGMILVTGPTGSGKTRTLYNALAELNKPYYNIITVEDPIEYELPGVNQVQIHADIGFSFASALRSILRQDPDIIMIGEMRDQETAHIGVEAALTGHQVLSTLHTNDAAGAVTRLTDMGIEPFLTTSSLSLACAQRLVRRVCNSCKEPAKVSDKLWEQLRLDPKQEAQYTYYKGRGCDRCKNKGYSGRCAVLELIPMTDEIRKLVLQRSSNVEIKQVAMSQGMQTLRMNGILKAREGITTLEEVLGSTMSD
ncbi:MAG: ATPase, T2SS/T4P/T4SS family [Verrucomicrobiae bacterium]|nr:ATPase, T2SS/T4P/T4SS family [Verrucomicrobiae bacterium]